MMKVGSVLIVNIVLLVIGDVNQTCAIITVDCVALGGPIVEPGEQVQVECFLESDVDQFLDIAFIDYACVLTGDPGSAGMFEITGFDFDPDGVIGWGPSTDGIPHWSPISEIFWNLSDCQVREEANDFFPVPVLPAGEPRYYGTLEVQASNAAHGSFDLGIENYTIPPKIIDRTIFVGGGPGIQLVSFAYEPLNLIVVNMGACCVNGSCAIIDAADCTAQGGTPLGAATLCVGDADSDGVDAACGDPCFGFPNDDSDGDGFCDSADNCPATPNADQADSDGDTVGDACDLCPGQDDLFDADNNFVPDCRQNIPTVSTWGIVLLAMVILVGAKLRLNPRGTDNKTRATCL